MSAPCPETGLIEALWDGRLGTEQAGALRTHMTTCQHCGSEALRLEQLRALVRSLPAPDPGTLAVARRRKLLLEAARTGSDDVAPPRTTKLSLAVAGVVLAAGLAFWATRPAVVGRGRALASSTVASARSSGELEVRVTPSAGARWSRANTGELETVRLDDGKLEIAVNRNGSSRRLTVRLPDGELVDEGTVFNVQVERARTRAVTVAEGSVTLRLEGQPIRHLRAGETFVAPNEATIASPSTPEMPAPPRAAGLPREAVAAPRTTTPSTVGAGEADACPNAPRFEDCVGAFNRGEYAAAAEAFARYSASCGRHAEDATYLRMVALARAGRSAEARELARAYLSRFPDGFRRKEAARLVAGD